MAQATFLLENFPTWAICHAVNGDPFEDEQDEQAYNNFEESLRKSLNWQWIDFVPETDEDGNFIINDFCPYPDFGKATETMRVLAIGEPV